MRWPLRLRILTWALVVFVGWYAQELGLIGWWM